MLKRSSSPKGALRYSDACGGDRTRRSESHDETMANIVMPGGKTVSEMVRPEIAAAYQSGKPLQLMAGY